MTLDRPIRFKFLENPEWYTEDENGMYVLTENAPEEVKADYEKYLKFFDESFGFVFTNE